MVWHRKLYENILCLLDDIFDGNAWLMSMILLLKFVRSSKWFYLCVFFLVLNHIMKRGHVLGHDWLAYKCDLYVFVLHFDLKGVILCYSNPSYFFFSCHLTSQIIVIQNIVNKNCWKLTIRISHHNPIILQSFCQSGVHFFFTK